MEINGSHNLVSMASRVCEYVRSEPRPFPQTKIPDLIGSDAGCGQALYLPSPLHRVRRPETQGNAPEDVSAGEVDTDPFADWQNAEPVKYPKGITEPCCKCAYLIGRVDKMIEMHRAQDAMIEEVIELASR